MEYEDEQPLEGVKYCKYVGEHHCCTTEEEDSKCPRQSK